MLEDRDHYKMIQTYLKDRFFQPLFEIWLELAVASQAIDLPNYELDPEKYRQVHWQFRGWAWIDPQKEAQANVMLLKNGLISVQDVQQNYGRDTEDLYAQLQAEKNLRDNFEVSVAYEPYGAMSQDNIKTPEDDNGN